MINESIIDRILGYVSGIILNFKCSISEVTKRKNARLLKRKCFVEK
jgi:hypothetical protein